MGEDALYSLGTGEGEECRAVLLAAYVLDFVVVQHSVFELDLFLHFVDSSW